LYGRIIIDFLKGNKNIFIEKLLCINETELNQITSVYQEAITDNRKLMPEVLNNAGVYFDPENPASIAVAVGYLIDHLDD